MFFLRDYDCIEIARGARSSEVMSSSAERSDSASFYLSFVSILVLSTATNQTEVALIQNRRILFQKKWPSNYDEAEKLIPALANLFKKMSPPEAILIVSGPGNFTGLRIGVTIANTLAFCYSIPLFSISTFEYLQKKKYPAISTRKQL